MAHLGKFDKRTAPLRAVAIMWGRDNHGNWKRALWRVSEGTSQYWSNWLINVNADHPFCLHCLSNAVRELPHQVFECFNCSLTYRVVD